MNKQDIQTVLNALQNSQLFVQASSNINVLEGFGQQLDDADEAIALLRAFLAEPSEPVAEVAGDYNTKHIIFLPAGIALEVGDKLFTHPAPSKPEPDKDLIQALTERDEYHDMADKLAEGVALHFDGDIGEHSSSNSPWDRALDLLDSAACSETMRLTHPASKPSEPVMIYHGGCTIDCGEHGHHNMEMLKLIPAGTKLFTHPASKPEPLSMGAIVLYFWS